MNQTAARIEIAPQVPEAAVQALEGVVDPEIPVLTIRDLGILRGARMDGETLVVTITPTYSGCPAMVEIRDSIHKALLDAGIADHRVETTLSPAWTTEWMSEEGREKLRAYGIAPPSRRGAAPTKLAQRHDVPGRGEGTRDGITAGLLSPYGENRPTSIACAAPTGSSQRHDVPGRGEGAAPTITSKRHDVPGRGEGAAPTGPSQRYDNFVGAAPRRDQAVPCPQCGSENTKLVSQFGSTACKALYQCSDCQEPFDHFKCH